MGAVCPVVGESLFQRCHGNLHTPSNNGRRLPHYKLLFTTLQGPFFPSEQSRSVFSL